MRVGTYGTTAFLAFACLLLQNACNDSAQPPNPVSGVLKPQESLEALVERLGGRVFPDRAEKGSWYVQLIGATLRSSDLKQLSAFPGIVRLALSDSIVADEEMGNVALIHGIRVLYLSNTRVTAKGIAQLSTLPLLQELFLDNTGIHGNEFECIGKLKGLKVLWIDSSQATYGALPTFESHAQLEDVMMMQGDGFTTAWSRGTGTEGRKAKYWKADR